MSKRTIIEIDEARCSGCGLCIPNCPEGALQLIDGKARLVSDRCCDGLGACLGYCPEGAIRTIEREAEPYDEAKVMANIARQGAGTIRAHLEHLRTHGEERLLADAMGWLAANRVPLPEGFDPAGSAQPVGCPACASAPARTLGNWPVQMHLLSPMAPQLRGRDVVLAADCTAFAMPSFHRQLLGDGALAIACPKLDQGTDIYREKVTALLDHARIRSLTVVMMEVPCCRGLLAVARQGVAKAQRKVPIRAVTLGIAEGAILADETVT
jgi:NAD-dependent dihydropyrimidine dehydrogenase PreA subunit